MRDELLNKLKQKYPKFLADIQSITISRLQRHKASRMLRFRNVANYDIYRSFESHKDFLEYCEKQEAALCQ